MKEYTTEKGNTIFYEVMYELGGYNYFTGSQTERGYYVIMQRKYNMFSVFSGLDKPDGAGKALVLAVKRQSEKARAEAESKAEGVVAEVVAMLNNQGKEV